MKFVTGITDQYKKKMTVQELEEKNMSQICHSIIPFTAYYTKSFIFFYPSLKDDLRQEDETRQQEIGCLDKSVF